MLLNNELYNEITKFCRSVFKPYYRGVWTTEGQLSEVILLCQCSGKKTKHDKNIKIIISSKRYITAMSTRLQKLIKLQCINNQHYFIVQLLL